MPATIQEIYYQNIRLLSEREQLQLASLILAQVTQNAPGLEPQRTGDITKFTGMYQDADSNASENEKIDADLARAYLEDYERNS